MKISAPDGGPIQIPIEIKDRLLQGGATDV
jgi:hypothetical protein